MVAMLKITSESFPANGFIPSRHTCEGENINPSLIVSNLPMNTKTLAVIMEDPDAPKGTFIHWLVWNIPPTNKIVEDFAAGEYGLNDFRKHHYRGPCPPEGETHRYFFKIFALDNFLHLNHSSKREELEAAMSKHIVGSGELIGHYRRKKVSQ